MAQVPSRPARGGGSLEDLRVNVGALRRKGLDRSEVRVEIPITWISAVLGDTDAQVTEAGSANFDVMLPQSGPVIVDGDLLVGFTVPCGRCLEPAVVDGAAHITGTFTPASAQLRAGDEDEEGLGLDADDLDTWTYDGTTMDLSDLVAEHVKIAYPMRALCARGETCQGLCSGCGTDLNATPPRNGACAKCDQPFEGPVGEPTENSEKDAESSSGEADGPLAAALRKLQLPD